MTRGARLLVPRVHAGRAADFATRARLIANQRHRARRVRRVRRSVRVIARLLAIALAALVVLVLTLTVSHWLRTTPLFAVTAVDVLGARRLAAGDVRRVAGIEPGANLLTLDMEAIADRLAALPGVRRARLVREVPHRVVVMLEEREPWALVNASGGGHLVWVDADGLAVGPEPRPGAPTVPILSGVEPNPPGAGSLPSDRLRAGLALLRAVQRSGGRVAARISEIDLAGVEGPVLVTMDGTEVRVGSEAWDERLARLDGVLGELEARGERVLTVDLRFRDLVVLTPRPEVPGARPSGSGGRRRAAVQAAPAAAGQR